MNYKNISTEFQPLDLILFSGTDFVSNGIKFIEKIANGQGDFSHVGLLINSEIATDLLVLQPNKWYVWESTFSAIDGPLERFSDNVPNILTGKGKFGVQIRDFEEIVEKYPGKIAWGRLLNNPYLHSPENTRKIIIELLNKYKDSSYDYDCLDLLATVIPFLRKPRNFFNKYADEFFVNWNISDPPGSWLFCSELAGLVYKELGLIGDLDPSNITPQDFVFGDPDGLKSIIQKPPIYILKNTEIARTLCFDIDYNNLIKNSCPIFIFDNINNDYSTSLILESHASGFLYYKLSKEPLEITYYYYIPQFKLINCIIIQVIDKNKYIYIPPKTRILLKHNRVRIYMSLDFKMYLNHKKISCDANNKLIVWDPQHLVPINNLLDLNNKNITVNTINYLN